MPLETTTTMMDDEARARIDTGLDNYRNFDGG